MGVGFKSTARVSSTIAMRCVRRATSIPTKRDIGRLGSLYVGFRSILVNARTPWDGALEIPFGSLKAGRGRLSPPRGRCLTEKWRRPSADATRRLRLRGFASMELDLLACVGLKLGLQVLHVTGIA